MLTSINTETGLPRCLAPARERSGERHVVEGMNDVEQLDGASRLVALQVADHVPRDGAR